MEAMIVVRSVLETLPEAVLAAVLKISVFESRLGYNSDAPL